MDSFIITNTLEQNSKISELLDKINFDIGISNKFL